jgi:hypothetical protein
LRLLNQFVAALLGVVLLSGCTVPIKAPSWAFGLVGKAQKNDYEVVDAFNTSVQHIPGLTWTVSGTYLPGSGAIDHRSDAASFTYRFSYARDSSRKWQLLIEGPSECAPSKNAETALTRALRHVLDRAGYWPARGNTNVTLVPAGQSVKRYAVALRAGRSFALNFKNKCQAGQGDDALWASAMMALHESTHAALRLSGKQPPARNDRERIAHGAETCIAHELKASGGLLENFPAVTQRLLGSYQLKHDEMPVAGLCSLWIGYLRAAGRAQLTPTG